MAGAAKKRATHDRKHGRGDGTMSPNFGSTESPKTSSTLSPNARGSQPLALDGNHDSTTDGRSRSDSNASAGPDQSAPVLMSTGVMNKNLDLGAYGAAIMNGVGNVSFPNRPVAPNSTGREITVKLNTFHVEIFPSTPIYQYDILIGSGTEKRRLIQRAWNSEHVKSKIGQGWIFDGNKLAWSLKRLNPEQRITVDLNEVDNPNPAPSTSSRPRREDKTRVIIRYTKQIDFAPLRSYLQGTTDFSASCLEAISFLDHLIRETPSQKYTISKRNFFARGNERTLLGGGIEAFKGVYASIRIAHGGFKLPARLSVNVDVANTTFWTESTVVQCAMQLCNARDYNSLSTMLQNVTSETPAFRALNRLRKVSVYTLHTGITVEEAKKKSLMIDRFRPKTSARTTMIKVMLPGSNKEQSLSVFDYFQERWNKRLRYPDLPLVQMTKMIKKEPILLPMEMITIVDNQRYPFKLSDKQTSQMILFAVTPPRVRWSHIEDGLRMLDWGNDRYLINYGLRVSKTPVDVKGRLLQNPKVTFGGGKSVDPRTSGRWDLRGQRFFRPYAKPLKSWGFCVVPSRQPIQLEQVQNFIRVFIKTLQGHGCKVENKSPVVIQGSSNPGECVQKAWEATGNAVNARPEILFFVVPDKSAEVYKRIKKSADCRYGVVSQVLQFFNVQKAQGQYCSNVAMKVNAKLGGVTAQAVGTKNWFSVPTMVIGADVSHGAPKGIEDIREPSVAAITMSFDREAIKYVAAVESNGFRVEMITKANFDDHLTKLVRAWISKVSKGPMPKHVIYMRDGVSEGQYAQVIQQEVKDIKNVFAMVDPKDGPQVKFTVIVGSKRHHVRFFPDGPFGDKNSNPLPGTLIESAVTHPREFDFYLCAHSAIKGTARPVHYQVLLNEMNLDAIQVQNMVYDGSYQYVRSTTPVSLYPAAYYAHLAAARGNHHIDENAAAKMRNTTETTPPPSEIPALLPMPTTGGIQEAMWYI